MYTKYLIQVYRTEDRIDGNTVNRGYTRRSSFSIYQFYGLFEFEMIHVFMLELFIQCWPPLPVWTCRKAKSEPLQIPMKAWIDKWGGLRIMEYPGNIRVEENMKYLFTIHWRNQSFYFLFSSFNADFIAEIIVC